MTTIDARLRIIQTVPTEPCNRDSNKEKKFEFELDKSLICNNSRSGSTN